MAATVRGVFFTRVGVGVGTGIGVIVLVGVAVTVGVGVGDDTAGVVLAGIGAAGRVADEQPAVSATARTAAVVRERIFEPF